MPIQGLEYAIGKRIQEGDVAPTKDPKAEAARITASITAAQKQAAITPAPTVVVNASKTATAPRATVQSRQILPGISIPIGFAQWLDSVYVKMRSLVKTGKLGQTYKTNQWDGLGRAKSPGRGAYQSAIHSQRPDGTLRELEKE